MQSKLKPFLSHSEITPLVKKLGKKITEDYSDLVSDTEPLLVVVTLKGALLFAADLVREIKVPIVIDFVRCASYGAGTKSSGQIKLHKDLENEPKGSHVLILDEIVDSGRTLLFLREHWKKSGVKSLKACTLLNKASRRKVEVQVEYIGQEIEDKFLVGYGLDFDEKYRNLPDIFFI